MISFWIPITGWHLRRGVSILAFSLAVATTLAAPNSPSNSAVTASLTSSVLIGAETTAEFGLRVAVDPHGDAYLISTGGATNSTTTDVFVTKFKPDGQTILYRTVLGGNGIEIAGGIAADADGNAYVVGTTGSSDFPVKRGSPQFQRFGESDAFVVKLGPQGQIIYSTLLGGNKAEQGRGIAVDSLGAAYVTGFTGSSDFLVPNVRDAPVPKGTFQARLSGPTDAFVAKLNSAGNKFEFKTFLGGNAVESGIAIAVDEVGSCYVFGLTSSFNFPTRNPAHPDWAGGVDTFIAKFNPQGSNLVFATYFGSAQNEVLDFTTPLAAGGDIALDAERNVYVASDSDGLGGGFVAKLTADGSAFRYVTPLGGTNGDSVFGLAADSSGAIVVTGGTFSPDFPVTPQAIQSKLGGQNDVFVGWLDAESGKLQYATFLGGTGADFGNGIAVARDGTVFVTGVTASEDFPITTERSVTPRATFLTRLSRNTLNPQVQIARFKVDSHGQPALQILAPPGRSYRLEASSNLRDWSLVTEFSAPTGVFEFTDLAQPDPAAWFYRTRTP